MVTRLPNGTDQEAHHDLDILGLGEHCDVAVKPCLGCPHVISEFLVQVPAAVLLIQFPALYIVEGKKCLNLGQPCKKPDEIPDFGLAQPLLFQAVRGANQWIGDPFHFYSFKYIHD